MRRKLEVADDVRKNADLFMVMDKITHREAWHLPGVKFLRAQKRSGKIPFFHPLKTSGKGGMTEKLVKLLTKGGERGRILPLCPHRLEAQDVALSRPKQEFESPWGHKADQPEPLGSISREAFLARLRFEQRHKLAELDDRDLLKKRGSGVVF